MDAIVPTDRLEKTLADRSQATVEALLEAGRAEAAEVARALDDETEGMLGTLRAQGAEKLAKARADHENTLALGLRRLQDAFWEKAVGRALGDFWAGLDGPTLDRIFRRRSDEVAPAFGRDPVQRRETGGPGERGFELHSADGKKVFRVSTRLLTEELLETLREELVRALFPGREDHAG